MNTGILALALAVAGLFCPHDTVFAQISEPDGAEPSEPAVCLAKRSDPVFADFEAKKDEWDALYKAKKADFHPKLMSHADELGKCVERALRRDLRANSHSTFGVQVEPDGRITKVALLASNHENNLYTNCLVRTVCKVQLNALQGTTPEVFTFNFNTQRKHDPRHRPWSLDPRV